MIFSIIIGVLIFGYAGWAFYRSINTSRQGKCASCNTTTTTKHSQSDCCHHSNMNHSQIKKAINNG